MFVHGPPGMLTRLKERIRRNGPVPYSVFVDAALYGPDGFYTQGGGAGRRRDFLTSPEVGPLFGAVIGRALDAWWADSGYPDPFLVVECGAGPGTLSRAILSSQPSCGPALRYVLVDRSPTMREAHARLPLSPSDELLGAVVAPIGDDEPAPLPGQGPIVASMGSFPAALDAHVVLANELLDNLAFDVAERTTAGWSDVLVGWDAAAQTFGEVVVPTAARRGAHCAGLAPDARPGDRIPLQEAAAGWVRDALDVVDRSGGRVVVIDYAASTTADIATWPWRDWCRTYRGHARGPDPLAAAGRTDITCDVAIDQLARVRAPVADRTQSAFLVAHGLDELVAEGREIWRQRGAVGDLAAVTARSRISEAEALTDPHGLGAFRVLEWLGR